ncbi:MAG: hypothetical protein MUE34_07380 [Acidimicrobiales bacterium]|nr:hypothetical protein [Acidimicrobiales bacterium]
MGDRYDLLQPAAAEAAIRSLPRRFRSAAAHLPRDPADRERLLGLTDAGRRALDALAAVVPALAVAEENVRRIAHREEGRTIAPLQPPPLPWSAVEAEVDRISAAAERLADLLRSLSARDWARAAAGPDGPVSPLDVARDAVRRSVEALREVERTLGAEPS